MEYAEKTILITGAAGFIGFYLAKRILEEDPTAKVVGYDSVNDYYDVRLKEERLRILEETAGKPDTGKFVFIRGNLADKQLLDSVFLEHHPRIVVNLAAQAGVRYSITNPEAYIEANIVGFFNILEACRHSYANYPGGVKHLIYASSSSVYGSNKKVPYSTEDKVDHPVSLYAATKKSDELLAYAYGKLYKIPMTGLRFFTVYGPLGRPDMAYFGFTDKLVKGEKIQIFNYGDMYRDFTYIDDIIEGVVKVMGKIPEENEDGVRYKVYNIGNSSPESLLGFVETLEACLLEEGIIDKKGERELLPMQPGDVYQTYADVSELEQDFGFRPQTSLKVGLARYAKWYKEFYG
ncbi:MAG: GDP-mannose 4,6-dehydratase [Acetatifactor sp.]|nr:GDP-mannose 4,6-dehydratase [Acetatifactor sp.]